jgi:putative PEP-CTERM system TPR-repeat lipoprotein
MIRMLLKWVALFVLLVGCSKQTTDEFLNQAQNYIVEDKLSDAEITLKSAIKEYPKNSLLRKHLGDLYLSQGLAALAEKELGRAYELGDQSTSTTLSYLKALNMQHKVEDVLSFIDKIENPSEDIISSLATYSGIAFYEQNFPSKARREFLSALQTTNSDKFTLLSESYLAFFQKDIDKTNSLLNVVLAQDPKFAEALSFKGRILYNQRRFVESAKTLEEYLLAYPNSHWVRIYYSQSLVRADLFEQADKEIVKLLILFPNQPLLNHLKSAVEFEAENFQLAKEHAERAMQYGDKQDATIFIAGVSAMRLENYEQAYSYLETLVSKLPATHPMQKLFSIVQFKVGYFQDAANSLDSLDVTDEEDFELFSSMSYGMLKAGRVFQAKELISKAESMLDGTPESLTRIGQLKLFINDMSGIDDLVKSLQTKPEQTQARLLLATAYMQNEDFDSALELAKYWQKREPDNVEAYNLEAFTYYKKGDLKQAILIYSDSIKKEPGNFRAHLFIKNTLVNQGELEKAAQQMNSYLKVQPSDAKALIQLYLVKKQQNDTSGVLSRIENIYNQSPTAQLQIVLAKIYNSERLYAKAAELLLHNSDQQGYPPFYWQTLTESQLNLDDDAKTLDIISKWQESYPSSIPAMFYKLILLERQGRLYEAIEVLAIWNKNRNHNEFLVKEALLNIKVNRFPEAVASMNRISDNSIYTPTGRYILGRIAAWSKNHLEAKKLLSESYQAIPKDDTAAWLSEQIKEVDGEEQAIAFLKTHLVNQPKGVAARTQLANILSGQKNPEAIKQYKLILEVAPQNIVALNNLAWDAFQQNDLGQAESYADKILELENHIAEALDTAAKIKLALGKSQIAVELLEKAYKQDTRNNNIAINYAKLLIKLEENQKAMAVLIKLTPVSGEQEIKVEEMLEALKS